MWVINYTNTKIKIQKLPFFHFLESKYKNWCQLPVCVVSGRQRYYRAEQKTRTSAGEELRMKCVFSFRSSVTITDWLFFYFLFPFDDCWSVEQWRPSALHLSGRHLCVTYFKRIITIGLCSLQFEYCFRSWLQPWMPLLCCHNDALDHHIWWVRGRISFFSL